MFYWTKRRARIGLQRHKMTMISSLSILNNVDMDSKESVLGYGISLILLNAGLYFVAPVVVIHTDRNKF